MSINGNHLPFQLSLTQVRNLINAADGMQPYADPEWKDYPQRSANEFGSGFNNMFNFTAGVKGTADGALSFAEKGLASHQLAWDRLYGRDENDATVNADPITTQNAKNGENFLNQIFWNDASTAPPGRAGTIRDGLDVDGDGKFTADDATVVAGYDGDASTLSSTDFDIAAQQNTDPTPTPDPYPYPDGGQQFPLQMMFQFFQLMLQMFQQFFSGGSQSYGGYGGGQYSNSYGQGYYPYF